MCDWLASWANRFIFPFDMRLAFLLGPFPPCRISVRKYYHCILNSLFMYICECFDTERSNEKKAAAASETTAGWRG